VKNNILSMIAILGLAAAAPAAQGQGYNPFQIGASGGIAFPTGDLGTGTNTGYNIAVVVGYKPQLLPISVRAEAAYNQFGSNGGGGSINIPSFTGNVVYELPLGVGFTPYAIGGAGLYRPSVGFTGGGATSAENDFGWNIGGGIKIPLSTSFETFVEARYNSVNVSGPNGGTASFIPVTVGILF
jgi:opacity protein-like surface antigen